MRVDRRNAVTGVALLYCTMVINVWLLVFPDFINFICQDLFSFECSWHSHKFSTWTSVLISMFTHSDWEHLLGNMWLLWIIGRKVFVPTHTPNEIWNSPFAFLWIYFGSQMSSVYGCRLLSYWLDLAWERKLIQGRQGWMTWVPIFVRDGWSTAQNFSQMTKLRLWQFVPGVGASAAVYGVVGSYVYTALCCRRHPAALDKFAIIFWSFLFLQELRGTPFSLEHIALPSEDNVDHAAHAFGCLGGFLLAYSWDLWGRTKDQDIKSDPD
jgi:membrane associated rhomboid family serine protease